VVAVKFWRWLRRQVIAPHREIRRPAFPPNEKLLLRIAAQRDLIGPREVRADRKLILENPDYQRDWPRDANGSPIDYEDLPV
jgi:hypothetical protein